jgi:hypothetical protein
MNRLETDVLEMIGEDISDPDVFTDDATGLAQIRDSINDGIEELTMLTGSVRRHFRIPLDSDMLVYQLNQSRGHIAWIASAFLHENKTYLEQDSILGLQAENPNWMWGTGTPRKYVPVGNDYLVVWPAGGSDILELDCVIVPARYTYDDEAIKLRDSYSWAVVHFAVGEFWASRGDAETAMSHHAEYLKHLGIQDMYPDAYDDQPRLESVKVR